MGLATIDLHSVKEHAAFHKMPKFGLNRPNIKQDTAMSKFYKEMYDLPDAAGRCRTAVRQVIHFFVNFDIFKWLYLAYYWVYLHQTWGFCETRCALSHYVDQ